MRSSWHTWAISGTCARFLKAGRYAFLYTSILCMSKCCLCQRHPGGVRVSTPPRATRKPSRTISFDSTHLTWYASQCGGQVMNGMKTGAPNIGGSTYMNTPGKSCDGHKRSQAGKLTKRTIREGGVRSAPVCRKYGRTLVI